MFVAAPAATCPMELCGVALARVVPNGPGRVEPPHADSKSAALSTELRGRARTGYRRYDTTFGGVSPRSKANRLSTRTRVIASRALASAVPRCGASTTFGRPTSSCGTSGSWTKTSRPANSSGDELAHEGVLVDDGAAGRVDDATALPDHTESARVDEAFGLARMRHVEARCRPRRGGRRARGARRRAQPRPRPSGARASSRERACRTPGPGAPGRGRRRRDRGCRALRR